MKRLFIFFLVGAVSTALLAFSCSKLSYYLLTRWKIEGGYLLGRAGFGLEQVSEYLVFPAKLILRSPTESLAIALIVLAINFSFWGVLTVAGVYCLTPRSRRTR